MVLTWWADGSPKSSCDSIICDGAVRSGKTLIMSLSYIIWSMSEFNGKNFGMAGKTIGSFKRNVWFNLKGILKTRGYTIRKVPDINDAFIISKTTNEGTIENQYYIFGGRDERSQDLVQGFTAAGFFFDEVALMPESFVDQAVARCSEEGAKLWFNCNPEGPFHWFKVNWIDDMKSKNAFRLHFSLDDNPSLSEKKKDFYKRMFRGVFYDRFINGLWVLAEGVIYSMFRKEFVIDKVPDMVTITQRWIGIDYGQSNATVYLLAGLGSDDKLYILDEYYHSGRNSVIQKSPAKYSKDYFKWKVKNGVDGAPVNKKATYIDPSAKGFMQQLHEDGERQIRQADNEVLRGIELISSLLDSDMIRVLSKCKNTINEFSSYRWDPKGQERGEDIPIKQEDHCMDALRYICNGNRLLLQHKLITQERNQIPVRVGKENMI